MSIKSNAEIIRDETISNANTALRVGGNLVEIAEDLTAKQTEIDLNTNKISFDSTSSGRLENTSGANTGDQNLTPYALNTAINTLTSVAKTSGVTSIALGNPASAGATRIEGLKVITVENNGFLTDLQVGCETGGACKVKFFTKNVDGTFNFVKEFSTTLVSGINTITPAVFGDSFTLFDNYYIGFFTTVATISAVAKSNGSSKFNFTDVTGSNIVFSDSSNELQYILSYKDDLNTTIKQDVAAINTTLQNNISTNVNTGVTNITLGGLGGTARTRVDKLFKITGLGVQYLTSLQVGVEVAGAGKIKFFTKNANGTFNFVKELAVTLTTGINTITTATFGTNFSIPNDGFVGFTSTGLTQFSVVTGAVNGGSGLINSDAYGNNISMPDSLFLMQFKLAYIDIIEKNIKTDINNLSRKSIYVSKTGLDTNTGKIDSPFLTIQKAINTQLSFGAKVIIGQGDYRETLDFSQLSTEDLELIAERNSIVRIMGSQLLASWAKTAARTNIYQAAFTGTIPTWVHPPSSLPFIFEDFNQSGLIIQNEIHPLQKGQTHRLQYTEIQQIAFNTNLATTLTDLDSQPGKYYLDSGIVYLHASSSSNPITSGFAYEIPVRACNIVPVFTNKKALATLRMDRMKFFFSNSGFQSAGFERVERNLCSVFGVVDDFGGWKDDASSVVSYGDEAGGCSNDGFNQHFDVYYTAYASLDIKIQQPHQVYFNPWSHDNKDDGMSCHAWGKCEVFGGLTEYNGDGGIVPAAGGTYICHNVIARRNNFLSDSSQAGFGTTNPTTGTGKNATALICYNCVAENNKFGFAGKALDLNSITLINPISRFNTSLDYYMGYGTLTIYNGKVENTSSSKYIAIGTLGVLVKPVLVDL